ncbi:MAG: c-type cytochrome [Candidatus Acidiferrales bacterium]
MKIATIAILALVVLAAQDALSSARSGQSSSSDEISVRDGVYTETQAERGHSLYNQNCMSCHGAALGGGEQAPPLAGGQFIATWDGLTVGDLFDRIRVSMPLDDPGRLSGQEVADISAYILNANGLPPGKNELAHQTELLKAIQIESSVPASPSAATAPPSVAGKSDFTSACRNDLPDPYETVSGWAHLPDGRKWGSTADVSVGPDDTVWVLDSCGADSCVGSDLPPVLAFDPAGKVRKSLGAGMIILPHGLSVDGDGNVWIIDAQPKGGEGQQIFKFSSSGKILMSLHDGTVAGGGANTFDQPTTIAIAANGEFFVGESRFSSGDTPRIGEFSAGGKFVKVWESEGGASGKFKGLHFLALDARGRLFLGDRSNDIEIFDRDGNFITEWNQFGRPSGIFIDQTDTIYVANSGSGDSEGPGHHSECERGIRIGSAETGKVTAFIPEPANEGRTGGTEGLAADREGDVYVVNVDSKSLTKYVKR